MQIDMKDHTLGGLSLHGIDESALTYPISFSSEKKTSDNHEKAIVDIEDQAHLSLAAQYWKRVNQTQEETDLKRAEKIEELKRVYEKNEFLPVDTMELAKTILASEMD